MAYTVFVDENGRYRDESARYQHGVFASYDEAVAACHRVVDEPSLPIVGETRETGYIVTRVEKELSP